ncbi:MAG: helix-turn-helix domain-containing protein [Bacteroidota bacterium]|nr:helix-turn-helix domain-containing protein [Bacteroidota bacterium]
MARPQNPNLNFNSLFVNTNKLKRILESYIESEMHFKGIKTFKSSYLPVFLFLFQEGNTTVQIASAMGISKQAASKMLKEMMSEGLVKTQINKSDRRSTIVLLSAKGKRMAIETRKTIHRLTENYKSLMGKNKYEQLVESMEALLGLHE